MNTCCEAKSYLDAFRQHTKSKMVVDYMKECVADADLPVDLLRFGADADA